MKTLNLKYFAVTILIFRGHVTTSVTGPLDSTYVVSYWWSIGTMHLSCTVTEILRPKIMGSRSWLLRSREVIGHVTIGLGVGTFLLVVNNDHAPILHGYGASKILGLRVWLFGVIWRHQSRDRWTRHMWFPIGGPLEPSVYLAVAGLADVPPLPRPPTAMSPPPVVGVRSTPTESCIEGHGGTKMILEIRMYRRYRRYKGDTGSPEIPEVPRWYWRYGDTGGTEVPEVPEVQRWYWRYGGTEVPEVRSVIGRYVRPQALE